MKIFEVIQHLKQLIIQSLSVARKQHELAWMQKDLNTQLLRVSRIWHIIYAKGRKLLMIYD